MGKKIFAAMIIVAFTAFAGYNIYQSRTELSMSDLALANVEALAENENDLCPNGCVSGGEGCYCNGFYPLLKEYNW